MSLILNDQLDIKDSDKQKEDKLKVVMDNRKKCVIILVCCIL